MGDGDDVCTGFDGKKGAALLVGAFFAGGDAGAFREDDDAQSLFQSPVAEGDELPECAGFVAAVDGDHAQESECPAEEGDEKQLFFEDEGDGALEVGEHEDGFPCGLVFGQNDDASVGDVFKAFDAVADVADGFEQPDGDDVPARDEVVATGIGQPAQYETQTGPQEGEQAPDGDEGKGAQQLFGVA